MLVKLEGPSGAPKWFNPHLVRMLVGESDGKTSMLWFGTEDGTSVKGTPEEVMAKLFPPPDLPSLSTGGWNPPRMLSAAEMADMAHEFRRCHAVPLSPQGGIAGDTSEGGTR
jgi:hypothetical protein